MPKNEWTQAKSEPVTTRNQEGAKPWQATVFTINDNLNFFLNDIIFVIVAVLPEEQSLKFLCDMLLLILRTVKFIMQQTWFEPKKSFR